MLKSLYPRIDWAGIKAIGFDMDGTLYDEAEFIAQVYEPIARYLADLSEDRAGYVEIYSWLFKRWLEKGSSYNKIFTEALVEFSNPEINFQQVEGECLNLFRNFKPRLSLSPRVAALLSDSRKNYDLFLVTDGSYKLQKRKFESLGLEKWFKAENTGFCGLYGPQYAKPSADILKKISLFSGAGLKPETTVYLGDRLVDEAFAAQTGFQFIKVTWAFNR